METSNPNLFPPDANADAQAVIESVMTGKPLDPEIASRIRTNAQKITDELQAKYGVLDIGVPAIRELRGELPE